MIGAQDYLYYTNQSDSALKLNLGKRKRYTVLEGYTLYNLLGAQKFNKIPIEGYKNIERGRHLPERGFESIRNFWKEYGNKTLEVYLVECIFFGYDYCLSFKEFPDPAFIHKHKE